MVLIDRVRRNYIPIAAFAITIIALFAVFSHIELDTVLQTTRRTSTEIIILAGMFLLIGAFLAVIRLWFIAADIGHRLSARDTMLALSLGQLAGATTVQFFGQILARTALLSKRGVTAPVNIAIAAYERMVAVGVSLLLAIGGGWYLFGKVGLNIKLGGGQLLFLLVGIITAVLAGAMMAWGSIVLKQIRLHLNIRMALSLLRTAIITLFIQMTTATAYVVIATSLAPEISTANLFAASLVVMFAASLPISFAGWGIRELSAVLALTTIGVQATVAVAVAVLVGALALLSVILVAGLAVIMPPLESEIMTDPKSKQPVSIESVVKWLLPVMAATAVFFQIYIPTATKELNVNLADPLAILGGIVFCIYHARTSWRLEALPKFILGMTAVIVVGYLIGYARFGFLDWAFTNKLLGWFILLGYGATGALIVKRFGKDGLFTITRTFAAAAAGIVALGAIMAAMNLLGVSFSHTVFSLPLSGFSQNRNAFAFLLLIAASITPLLDEKHRPWILGILVLGLVMTGSRAAAGTLCVILAIGALSSALRLSDLGRGVALALVLLIAIWVVPTMTSFASLSVELAPRAPSIETQIPMQIGHTGNTSDIERMTSFIGGARMFMAHPVFGAGLGAYLAEQLASSKEPIHIIHNSALWLLAEFGVVGFLIFAIPFLRLLLREGKNMVDPVSASIALILLSFAIMSLAHELLYQRGMWLLLGALLAWVPQPKKRR